MVLSTNCCGERMMKIAYLLLFTYFCLPIFSQAIAQPSNGQIANGPAAPRALLANPVTSSSAANTGLNSSYSANTTASRVVAPVSTVGNTPSNLQGTSANSGYSAYGSTVNTNINNTAVGNRSSG